MVGSAWQLGDVASETQRIVKRRLCSIITERMPEWHSLIFYHRLPSAIRPHIAFMFIDWP